MLSCNFHWILKPRTWSNHIIEIRPRWLNEGFVPFAVISGVFSRLCASTFPHSAETRLQRLACCLSPSWITHQRRHTDVGGDVDAWLTWLPKTSVLTLHSLKKMISRGHAERNMPSDSHPGSGWNSQSERLNPCSNVTPGQFYWWASLLGTTYWSTLTGSCLVRPLSV